MLSNNACTRQVGFAAFYRQFSGFKFFCSQADSNPAHLRVTLAVRQPVENTKAIFESPSRSLGLFRSELNSEAKLLVYMNAASSEYPCIPAHPATTAAQAVLNSSSQGFMRRRCFVLNRPGVLHNSVLHSAIRVSGWSGFSSFSWFHWHSLFFK